MGWATDIGGPSHLDTDLEGMMDRLTSMGLWRNAGEFLDAAKIVHDKKGGVFTPTYYLVCHSIELSLKAFLLRSGSSKKELIRLGHDLECLLNIAEHEDLGKHMRVSGSGRSAIKMINPYYKEKGLNYPETGAKTYCDVKILIDLAGEMIDRIKTFCTLKPASSLR
jgi:HEPN domain